MVSYYSSNRNLDDQHHTNSNISNFSNKTMNKLNQLGGCPSNQPVQSGTIRMTVQVEIPYDSEIMNYCDKSRQKFKDFINSDSFTGMSVEARGSNSPYD